MNQTRLFRPFIHIWIRSRGGSEECELPPKLIHFVCFSFDFPGPPLVTLKVYNILGAEVGTLLDMEALDDRLQEIDFEAGSLPTGIYIYRIVATGFDEDTGERSAVMQVTKKMMLVK